MSEQAVLLLRTTSQWHVGHGNGAGHIFAASGRMRLETGGTTPYPIAKIGEGRDAAEDEANGKLMAAAPELAGSLKALLTWMRQNYRPRADDDPTHEAICHAYAVLQNAGVDPLEN